MRTLIEQLDRAVEHRLYYVALFSALAIPDIAGALDSADGQATRGRYVDWFERWIRPVFGEGIVARLPEEIRSQFPLPEGPLTGEACYRFRCSLLHQGSSQHPKSPYARIIFIEPGATSTVVHGCILNDALAIDLSRFCREIVIGTHRWLAAVEGTPRYQVNYARFARRHADGLVPYIGGVAVIG